MVTVRFSNGTDQSIDLMVEPWGAVEPIPPGGRIAVHYDPPAGREDTSFAEHHREMIRFWVEGDSYALEIDGKLIQT
jgi:hypothetical protein